MLKHDQNNGIESNNELIETLSIQQLIKRWDCYSKYTLENIYEIANKGYFGIYFRLGLHNKRSSHNIEEYLKNRITVAKLANNTDLQNYYVALQDNFHDITKTKPLLFEEKLGYVRLATAIEEKIFPACTTGSINKMIREKQIMPVDYNNTFGFIEVNAQLIANSYYRNPDSGFEKSLFASEKNCFVFLDQIKHFETQPEFKQLFTLLSANNSNNIIEQTSITPIETKEIEPKITENYIFKKTGDAWFIKFKELEIHIQDRVGLHYLNMLLHFPNQEFDTDFLVSSIRKHLSEDILKIGKKTLDQHFNF